MNRISNDQIRGLYQTGNYSYGDLAKRAGVSRERIRQILTRNSYFKLYKRIWVNGRSVREHRHIMEQYLDRKLRRTEHVHHKDGNTRNNELSNLEIVTDRKAHFAKHLILYQAQVIQ